MCAATLRAQLAAARREREHLERRMELSANEVMHANAELNALFAALPDLFLRVDVRGMVVDHKGGGAGALGHLLEEDPWNTPLAECLVPDAVEPIQRVLHRSWNGDRTARGQYTIGRGPDVRHFEVRALPLPNKDIFIAIEEVTERAANQALLREQQDRAMELKSFAAAASHDLRAPLRNIDVLAEFAQEERWTGRNGLPPARQPSPSLIAPSVRPSSPIRPGSPSSAPCPRGDCSSGHVRFPRRCLRGIASRTFQRPSSALFARLPPPPGGRGRRDLGGGRRRYRKRGLLRSGHR